MEIRSSRSKSAVCSREGGIEAADELPLPRSLRELVHERLARLPSKTRRVLLAAAALSQPRLSLLGRTAAADLRPAVEGGIVKVEGDVVVFAHPLLALVPYEEAPPAERHRIHGRLARIVRDAEERARHLALSASGPDERIATELDRAARLARARGAPDAAAELVRLARGLTPGSNVERLLAEAEYTFESGDSAGARALIEEALDLLDAGPRRAHALARLAWFRGCWGDDPHRALALLDGAVEQAAGDLAVEAEVFECLTWQSQFVGRHEDAARYARLGAEAADELGDPHWIALLGLAVALAEGRVGRARAARTAVARLENLSPAVAHLRVINDPAWVQAIFLASDGDLEGALALARPLHVRALERGDESSVPSLLEMLALIEFMAGNWKRAEELIVTGSEIAVRTDQENQHLALRAWRAFLDAHLGRVESARAGAAETIAAAVERRLPVFEDVARWTLMLLELSTDHPAAALSEFDRLLHPDRGIGEPHSFSATTATRPKRWRQLASVMRPRLRCEAGVRTRLHSIARLPAQAAIAASGSALWHLATSSADYGCWSGQSPAARLSASRSSLPALCSGSGQLSAGRDTSAWPRRP